MNNIETKKGGKMEKKEIKLRIFPKNKENILKIYRFKMRILISSNHSNCFVDGLKKIPGRIPAPAGLGYWGTIDFSYKREFCGEIFFPFNEYYDFPEWNENEWITLFACEEIRNSLKWYCEKILKLKCEETILEY